MSAPSHKGTWSPQWRVLISAIMALAIVSIPVVGKALEVPALKGRVTDLANLLDPSQQQQISQALATYEQEVGHQFALLIIPSLEGDPLEDFSIRVVEQWKLGSDKDDNGLLLLVAVAERKIRIEVGYGLEGVITDALSSRVIRDVMRPAFRKQEFATGIREALNVLMAAGAGEEVELPEPDRREGTPWFFNLIFLAIIFMSIFGRNWLPFFFVASALGSGRGGWSSGGGGGFGGGFSGGGGGFGGGGASGGW